MTKILTVRELAIWKQTQLRNKLKAELLNEEFNSPRYKEITRILIGDKIEKRYQCSNVGNYFGNIM